MNFLEIAKRVRQEVGYSGVGPTSVQAQTGAYAKIVDWVKSSAEAIHLAREQWRFDWAQFTAPLVDGKSRYDVALDWGLNLRSLHLGPASGPWPDFIEWAEFRLLEDTEATGMPSYFTLSPDHCVHFYPAPSAGLALTIEYYRGPQKLAQNTDVPRIPEQYHMAIVWGAVAMAAEHDENQPLLVSAIRRYSEVMQRMERTELPGMAMAEPMA